MHIDWSLDESGGRLPLDERDVLACETEDEVIDLLQELVDDHVRINVVGYADNEPEILAKWRALKGD